MWKYSNQIKLRWLSFLLTAILLIAAVWQISGLRSEILTQSGLKAELTRLSVTAEFLPLWIWPLVFFLITILMLLGVPSLICFAGLMIAPGFYSAFIITFLCQLFVTRISIHRAWKIADSEQYQKSINPALKAMLWQNQNSFKSFAFWARVYFAFPLRTVDYLTPMIQPDEKQLKSTLAPAGAAIFLRMLIPTLWLHSLLKLVASLTPDPTANTTMFLLWSSALVAYTIIPRVPELFICSEHIKPVLTQIESQTKPVKKQSIANGTQKPQGNSSKKTARVESENRQPVAES